MQNVDWKCVGIIIITFHNFQYGGCAGSGLEMCRYYYYYYQLPIWGLCRAWVLLLGLRDKLLQQANQQGLQMPYGMDVLNGMPFFIIH